MTKKQRLTFARKELKKQFRGIEPQIDRIINEITSWYLFPEKQSRPSIINIWGLTGTGKSSLIRALVGYLGLNNVFNEVRVATETKSESQSTLHNVLMGHGISAKDQAVLFLDEFQHYRTIKDGEPVANLNYPDLWTLLSDGKLLSPEYCLDQLKGLKYRMEADKIEFCIDTLKYYIYNRKKVQAEIGQVKDAGEALGEVAIFLDSIGNEIDEICDDSDQDSRPSGAINHCNKEQSTVAFEKLMAWPLHKILDIRRSLHIHDARFDSQMWKTGLSTLAVNFNNVSAHTINKDELERGLSYESLYSKILEELEYFSGSNIEKELQYNKLLIIIAGNQDSLYSSANSLFLTYKDVDDVYESTKEYKWYELKNILLATLAPEHISRLGMTHIMYPSISESAYKQILEDRLALLTDSLEKDHGVKVAFTINAKELLYKNGAFPTQGVRPLLALVDNVVSNIIVRYLSTVKVKQDVIIDIDQKNKKVLANSKPIADIALEVTEKEDALHTDSRLFTAVHEAGHGIIHMYTVDRPMAIDMAPLSPNAAAWTKTGIDENTMSSIEYLLSYERAKICCSLGGKVAEELVFGKESESWGCYGDVHYATSSALLMAQKVAAAGNISASTYASDQFAFHSVTTTSEQTDIWVENLLKAEMATAREILVKCKPVMVKLVQYLMEKPYLSKKDSKVFLEEVRGIRKSGNVDTISSFSYKKRWKAYTNTK